MSDELEPGPQGPPALLDALLSDVKDHSSPSATKYNAAASYLEQLAGLDVGAVYVAYISKPGNTSVRFEQSRRAKEARLLVGLIGDPEDLEATKVAIRSIADKNDAAQSYVLVSRNDGGTWQLRWALKPGEEPGATPGPVDTLHQALGLLNEADTYRQRRTQRAGGPTLPGSATTMVHDSVPMIPLVLDERTRRMFRTAVASHRAVMLIGPPGTGKTRLVDEMQRELLKSPQNYGMTSPHELLTVTADESWTTRELVGGDSVDDDGKLRFSLGYVLQAIQHDKWLLIDEANRADLDRVFGGLLTWLSGQRTTVGRYSPTHPATITLDWARTPTSEFPEGWAEAGFEPDDDLVFAAGNEWRLIGTYNSVDAHRVFRLGLALGRRFAQVPIPPPNQEDFRSILDHHIGSDDGVLRRDLLDTISRLYEIHGDTQGAVLGPAPFLGIPGYVIAATRHQSGEFQELLAEGYLAAFGTWLARLDAPVLEEIGKKLESSAVLGSQWEWLEEQLRNLA